ncbi:hypothetical protein G9A89_023382 [Geosiphon pyriformis]|nr:hypothetical protein G9A89_023382 [Geosiphon pyriformis]
MEAYCTHLVQMITPFIYVGIKVEKKEIILFVKGERANYLNYWSTRLTNLIQYLDSNTQVDAIFYTNFLQAQNQIIDLLQNTQKLTKLDSIVAVGHGVGGVYATFAILQYWERVKNFNRKPSLKVYTFGQPRIGDRYFAQFLNSLQEYIQIYRFTHDDDPLPRLPTNSFTHSMMEFWIDDSCDCNSMIYKCPGLITGTNEYLFIEESNECVNQFNTTSFRANNGPYLGIRMGICLDPLLPLSS